MATSQTTEAAHDESMPLLVGRPLKKSFYRARPLWLVPFAIVSSLTLGMTLASRLEVVTQISCNNLYGHHEQNHIQSTSSNFSPNIAKIPFYAFLDPLRPHDFPPFPERGVIVVPDTNDKLQPNAGMGLKGDTSDSDDTNDPRRIPSTRCLSDPAVQAGAARLQTVMTTTMGILSALTTGWWGHFGERHGRTSVLALSIFGTFLTNLIFILVSIPSSPFSKHGHILLLVSPVIEGLLGGHPTFESATSAYLSDCTSSGSRANIFSRFSGTLAVGFSIGPVLGSWLIRHPVSWFGSSSMPGRQTITSVFWAAVLFSFINLLLIAFVLPESLDEGRRERAMIAYQKPSAAAGKKGKARERTLILPSGDPGSSSSYEEDNIEGSQPRQEETGRGLQSGSAGIISHFLSPLAVFLPVVILDSSGLERKRRDWSLTLLAMALFGYMLSTGLYQVKYRYAEHTYGWGAEQLGYYISFMGGARVTFLLFLLPTLIAFLKPKLLPPDDHKGKDKPSTLSKSSKSNDASISTNQLQQPQPEQQQPLQKDKKPKPTRAQLGQEIGFDLLLTRYSLMIDILSHTLVILFPAPTLKVNNFENHMSLMSMTKGRVTFTKSQAMFVVASSFASLGSGVVPAVHSLALCMLQVRALDAAAAASADGGDANAIEIKEEGNGVLFGAFAMLQAVGQTIISPMIFGLLYSGTVAKFPKAIFTMAAGLLVCVLTMVFCMRNPVRPAYPAQSKWKKIRDVRDNDQE